jgi:hypothetical protein
VTFLNVEQGPDHVRFVWDVALVQKRNQFRCVSEDATELVTFVGERGGAPVPHALDICPIALEGLGVGLKSCERQADVFPRLQKSKEVADPSRQRPSAAET